MLLFDDRLHILVLRLVKSIEINSSVNIEILVKVNYNRVNDVFFDRLWQWNVDAFVQDGIQVRDQNRSCKLKSVVHRMFRGSSFEV